LIQELKLVVIPIDYSSHKISISFRYEI
jgi:hypothetical protein